MLLPHVLVACFVAMAGPSGPPPPQSRPPDVRPPSKSDAPPTIVIAPDVVSLERIRSALKRGALGEITIFPVGPLALPPPPAVIPITPDSVATFRVQIEALRMPTFEEALKEYLASPAPSVNAGAFDLYAGEHRAGAGPGLGGSGGGGSAYVHPSALVDWIPRLARRRAEAKARQQVEAELQALLAAQKKASEKPEKEPR